MSKLHIFIDGTWLIKICSPTGILASKMLIPSQFKMDFNKLRDFIFQYISSLQPTCTEVGDCYFVTSIFDIPPDVDTWTSVRASGTPITREQIGKTKWNANLRQDYANRAVSAGYCSNGSLRVGLKDWMIPALANKRYQEKQVDTTVVALLVKYAITRPDDFFAVVAGDSDILPAVNIAYPEFTEKICIVTTHPDQLNSQHRQTSFSYLSYTYSIDPLFFKVDKITEGNFVYVCTNCNKVFLRDSELQPNNQPFCQSCIATRT